MIETVLTIVLHMDRHLGAIVHEYGIWTYLILFFIIFLETGFVITPFLPGDSLLFVAGAAAAAGILDLQLLVVAFIVGAIIGDTVNYGIGNYIGLHVFQKRFPTLIKKEYLDRTYGFYEKYGGLTIFIARFVPVVRTFAPFLAGVGAMQYRRFLFYNVLGGISWTLVVVLAGYYFGTMPVVKDNMNILLLLVLLVSLVTVLALIWGLLSAYFQKKNLPPQIPE